MIAFLLVSTTIGLAAFIILEYFEQRVTSKRRMALATGGRTLTGNTFDKDQIIANLVELNAKRTKGRLALSEYLNRSGLRYKTTHVRVFIIAVSFLCGIISFLILQSFIIAGLVGAFVALVVPRIIFAALIAKREAAFLEDFPDALEMISRGLRAGITLGGCIKQIVESTKDPLRSEFAYIVDLQKLGMPLSDAIRKLSDRFNVLDVQFFTIVIDIQQKTGGNLAEILENISRVIRGRRELRAKIKSLISEAKASAIIIAIVPVGFGFLSYHSDPESFSAFWTEPIGRMLLALSVVLYSIGVGIFIKLANPKI